MMGGEKLSAIRYQLSVYQLSVISYQLIMRARVRGVGLRQNLARSVFLIPYSLFLMIPYTLCHIPYIPFPPLILHNHPRIAPIINITRHFLHHLQGVFYIDFRG
jgi:hypothetical protein